MKLVRLQKLTDFPLLFRLITLKPPHLGTLDQFPSHLPKPRDRERQHCDQSSQHRRQDRGQANLIILCCHFCLFVCHLGGLYCFISSQVIDSNSSLLGRSPQKYPASHGRSPPCWPRFGEGCEICFCVYPTIFLTKGRTLITIITRTQGFFWDLVLTTEGISMF